MALGTGRREHLAVSPVVTVAVSVMQETIYAMTLEMGEGVVASLLDICFPFWQAFSKKYITNINLIH